MSETAEFVAFASVSVQPKNKERSLSFSNTSNTTE